MARPQVEDGGDGLAAKEGSCEYFEQADQDSWQGVVLQLGGWRFCVWLRIFHL
jgi:hypothetical protein